MNAAMHTIIMTVLFQTFDIKILNANDIEVILKRNNQQLAARWCVQAVKLYFKILLSDNVLKSRVSLLES